MLRILSLLFFLGCWSNSTQAQKTPEERLQASGIELPSLPQTNRNTYNNLVRSGNLLFLSGKGPLIHDGKYITGRAGSELSSEQVKAAARLCAIHLLAVLKKELGNLGRIKRMVKVNGFINSSADFYDQSTVMDGCSELLIVVLGEKGKHARTAVSTVSLPFNWTVEVDAIVEVYP